MDILHEILLLSASKTSHMASRCHIGGVSPARLNENNGLFLKHKTSGTFLPLMATERKRERNELLSSWKEL